jgi:hypothetical protein
MIYEMRTYDLKPRSLDEFEKRFGERLPGRQQYSDLAGLWHTEIGPLNQVVHIWPYDDMAQRTDIRTRSVADGKWPPNTREFIVHMRSEILIPAPFMEPMKPRDIGPVYEMRTYTYAPGDIPKVLDAWSTKIAERVEFSPLAGCWYSDLGDLNRFVHLWAYKSFEVRASVRRETREKGIWPPSSGVAPLRQENKVLFPAACSPMQ